MSLRIVMDTNVLIFALRSNRGPAFRLLSLVGSGAFEICLSSALALEYEDVASRMTQISETALDTILGFLCGEAHQQKIFFLWRPALPHPGDEMVLELAVASRASHLVTYNLRDFRSAREFGVTVLRPGQFLQLLDLSTKQSSGVNPWEA